MHTETCAGCGTQLNNVRSGDGELPPAGRGLNAQEHLSDLQFKYYDQSHRGWRGIDAVHGENVVGSLQWAAGVPYGSRPGEIEHVEVHEDYRRQGIATELLRQAREKDPRVRHSTNTTADGRTWSKAAR